MFLREPSSHPSSHFSTKCIRLGMDLGSTTAKLALIDSDGTIIQRSYQRHQANVSETLLDMLLRLQDVVGSALVMPFFTGSAGMGLAERTGIVFVQEVVAASTAVMNQYPHSRMLIDIGGEDCKMIFFDKKSRPDMRMNGNCAGGTGAFIDQMSSLMNSSPQKFDDLAQQSLNNHVIASRCGVFAKTDVQNLIHNGVAKCDIARSVFQAVACQTVTTLARGHKIEGPVVLVGGPLYFYRSLRESILSVLSLSDSDAIVPDESLIYPAFGAALSSHADTDDLYTLAEIIDMLQRRATDQELVAQHETLFANEEELSVWSFDKSRHDRVNVPINQAASTDVFLGIDAGSTTTKIVLIDEQDQILFQHYAGNLGEPINSVREGLLKMEDELGSCKTKLHLIRSVVTGYGEELIKSAFEIDQGIVETLAHYRAARKLDEHVSFILDIGGQDMKAIFIEDGVIKNIEVNEACSSGCGSFIETFADSLGYSAEQFGELACTSHHPVDLGSRCTVFMNSCVKQALRQGNDVADVAAGLAYSVIQNCLNKVLRIADISLLGDKIIVQGGTFKNSAVLRAFEKLLGREVIRPNIAEYMGAYGAAIIAREQAETETYPAHREHPLYGNLISTNTPKEKILSCHGCTNQCNVRTLQFSNNRKYFTGNRCERIFTNRNDVVQPGRNLLAEKLKLLQRFSLLAVDEPSMTIGIPMVMNTFENYPFWATFFSELGWQVVSSTISDRKLVKDSVAATIMSDNICYPAKLAHAHILDLVEKKVDRIFYPRVVFERSEFKDSANHYNCPIVSGYPDVIESAIDPEEHGVPMDSPTINFNDNKLLRAACLDYARRFKVEKSDFQAAFSKALQAVVNYNNAVQQVGRKTIEEARKNQERMIVLGGRPYHVDPVINHGIPDMIAAMGIHVLPEDALPLDTIALGNSLEVTDQWEYSNRLYRAAQWVGSEPLAEFVQLNSFGCGPDAIVIDELKTILSTYSRTPVVLKIDEISSIGSAKLRVRSLVEARFTGSATRSKTPRVRLPVFKKADRHRTILLPEFSPFYSFFARSCFTPLGYNVEFLPPPNKESVQLGLKYTNNDICYPAIVTIGDIIKALALGKYHPDDIAVGFTETGGQCRATNYISVLKKALLNAGYSNIPVVSVSFSKKGSNDQPGFILNRPKLISLIFSSLLVIDQLISMYHATAVREKVPGQSLALLKQHLENAQNHLGKWTIKNRQQILRSAIDDFNNIPTYTGNYPKAGLVGEIYVKYNPFSNGNIADRLMEKGIQVVMPPMINFFIQTFVNTQFNHLNHIEKASIVNRKTRDFLRQIIEKKVVQVNNAMTKFRHSLEPLILPRSLANKAGKVLCLSNQAGEGWLLPGEIVVMAESGIRNIISLQPFGCIANHVVAKGISTKLGRLFPDLNILNLDMDAGNSDANIQNRLDFFIHSAKSYDDSHSQVP